MGFKNDVERLKDSLIKIKKYGFSDSGNFTKKSKIFGATDSEKYVGFDFKEKRLESYYNLIKSSLIAIKNNNLKDLIDSGNKNKIYEILEYIKDFDGLFSERKIDELLNNLNEVLDIYNSLNIIKNKGFNIKLNNIPFDIREEVKADFNEMDKCFNFRCYRSAVILCGRILEILLHRKYYDVTGFDILEKSPGIGLGKLIAKLVEKKVKFNPGLTQQIHLVNQVRVNSVHKKKEVFNPSKEQTQAMILFTLDVINKLF